MPPGDQLSVRVSLNKPPRVAQVHHHHYLFLVNHLLILHS